MPVLIAEGDRLRSSSRGDISIAFVNNMPDSAFQSTERQFVGLLAEGSGDSINVSIRRFALRGVGRGPEISKLIDDHYGEIETLWRHRPDAIVITGAEPLTAVLTDEIYWPELSDLLTRAVAEMRSVLLSCLAAHAALQLFDGLKRELLPVKRAGVFVQDVVANHRLTKGLARTLAFPHSRLNDVPTKAVLEAGYKNLISSSETGWTVVSRTSHAGELILIQGHPEYGAATLLREYRRDVERYLTGRRLEPPVLPARCVASEDMKTVMDFHDRISFEDPKPELLAALPFDDMVKRAQWPWRSSAVRFYDNWIIDVSRRAVAPRRASSS